MEGEQIPLPVAEQMAPATKGRIFVFVPFHPVPSMEHAFAQKGSFDSAFHSMKTQRKFNEWMGTLKEDPASLVNFWDKRYREGLEMIRDQLGPVERHQYERKVPQVVVFGDKWSEASAQLKTAGPDDTVYIVGHTDQRQESLYKGEGELDLQSPLSPEALLARMEEQGIPQTIGKIKIFACSGAAHENAFVPRFVQASREQNRYAGCHVVGYTKDVSFGIDRIERVAHTVKAIAANRDQIQQSLDDLNHLLEDGSKVGLEEIRQGVPLAPGTVRQPEDVEAAQGHATSVRQKLQREEKLRQTLDKRLDQRAGMKLANVGGNTEGTAIYERASNHAVDYKPREVQGVARPVVAPPSPKVSCRNIL